MSDNPLRIVVAGPVSLDEATSEVLTDGPVQEIRFPIGTGAAQNSGTSIPNDAIIGERYIKVTTPYSPGTTIEVGIVATPDLLIGTADNIPTSNGVYAVPPDDTVWVGPATVLVTIAGAPVAGAGFVVVQYVQAPQA